MRCPDNREFVDDPSQLENEDKEREFFKKLEEASQKEVMPPQPPDDLPVEDSKIDQAKEEEENVNEADDSDTDFEPFVDDDEDNEGDYICKSGCKKIISDDCHFYSP